MQILKRRSDAIYLTEMGAFIARRIKVNYWSNYPKFAVSLMKSFYGDAAQKENDWGFEWLPKWDQAYDV
ncbi:hypothetical protein V6E40_07920, partial [Enterobacter hormaechei]